MPCLLMELSKKEVSKHRSSSESLSPLLIYLVDGCLPNGLFTSLVASLKNSHGWKLAYRRRKHKNCIMFVIPGNFPGTVTLLHLIIWKYMLTVVLSLKLTLSVVEYLKT